MLRPGRNVEMLRHMKSQAQAQDIPPAGYCGYITFDEMPVQVILFIVLLVSLSLKLIRETRQQGTRI